MSNDENVFENAPFLIKQAAFLILLLNLINTEIDCLDDSLHVSSTFHIHLASGLPTREYLTKRYGVFLNSSLFLVEIPEHGSNLIGFYLVKKPLPL